MKSFHKILSFEYIFIHFRNEKRGSYEAHSPAFRSVDTSNLLGMFNIKVYETTRDASHKSDDSMP